MICFISRPACKTSWCQQASQRPGTETEIHSQASNNNWFHGWLILFFITALLYVLFKSVLAITIACYIELFFLSPFLLHALPSSSSFFLFYSSLNPLLPLSPLSPFFASFLTLLSHPICPSLPCFSPLFHRSLLSLLSLPSLRLPLPFSLSLSLYLSLSLKVMSSLTCSTCSWVTAEKANLM